MKKLLKFGFVLASLTFAVFLSAEKAYSADFDLNSVIYENDYLLGTEEMPAGLQVQSEYYTFSSIATYSNAAESESGDIFDIVHNKMMSTLKDLRQIVYIIAGFGLIMFAVMAIFNKISFKHLAYIMIGLSLLSLMFPFIEYFSGANIISDSERQLTFGNFVAVSEDSGASQISGGEINPANCPDGVCPLDISDEELDQMMAEIDRETEEALNNLANEDIKIDMSNPALEQFQQQFKQLSDAGCSTVSSSSKSEWKDGVRNVCNVNSDGTVQITQETCQGVVKNGVCKQTFGQVIKNIGLAANNALGAANSAAGAISGAIGMVGNIQDYGNMIANAANSGGNIFEQIWAVSNAIGAAGTGISHGVNSIIANTEGAIGYGLGVGTIISTNYENNPTGQNSASDRWYGTDANGNPTSGLRAGLEGIAGAVGGASDGLNNITNTGAAVSGAVGGIINSAQSVGNAVENTSNKLSGNNNSGGGANYNNGGNTGTAGQPGGARRSGSGYNNTGNNAGERTVPMRTGGQGVKTASQPVQKTISAKELDAFFE